MGWSTRALRDRGAFGPVGQRGNYSVNSYANWFNSGSAGVGDVSAIGGSASYSEQVFRNLSARAAVAISMLDSDIAPEIHHRIGLARPALRFR